MPQYSTLYVGKIQQIENYIDYSPNKSARSVPESPAS